MDTDNLFWDRVDLLERVIAAERSRAQHGHEKPNQNQIKWLEQQLSLVSQLKEVRRAGPKQ